MQNIKLSIEYDGTNFAGWQRQPRQRTVQQELQAAIKKITGEAVVLTGAGRTDAGVHSRGQVANFFTNSRLAAPKIFRGLNAVLPDDIRVTDAKSVSADFDARRWAKSRTYRYHIVRSPSALFRHLAWFVPYQLNFRTMNTAARYLLGAQDFSTFCVMKSKKQNNCCNISVARWRSYSNNPYFEVTADRFLHSMVRSIVGTLIEVGRGKISTGEFRRILQSRDRHNAGPTAPAHGLTLWKVAY